MCGLLYLKAISKCLETFFKICYRPNQFASNIEIEGGKWQSQVLHIQDYFSSLDPPTPPHPLWTNPLTYWGRVTHICVSKLTIIGSDNGLSPERRQANIWTNAGILLIGTLGTNFSEILSEIHTFSFKKMHLKTSSAKRRPFCLDLNVSSWLVIGDGNDTSVYKLFINT